MSALLAVRILVLTGMTSAVVRLSPFRRFVPAKQLWHPVSASAVMVAQPAGGVCAKPKSAKSVLRTLAVRVMVGWGCDLRFTHVSRRLS